MLIHYISLSPLSASLYLFLIITFGLSSVFDNVAQFCVYQGNVCVIKKTSRNEVKKIRTIPYSYLGYALKIFYIWLYSGNYLFTILSHIKVMQHLKCWVFFLRWISSFISGKRTKTNVKRSNLLISPCHDVTYATGVYISVVC